MPTILYSCCKQFIIFSQPWYWLCILLIGCYFIMPIFWGKHLYPPLDDWPDIDTGTYPKYFTWMFHFYLEEASKCDWSFCFAHQGDHFTILTGLAHSRLKTLCKWMEANVSDVLLTCWANNPLHQQFYMGLLVPTVKLTMHLISIRQENDPCSPRFFPLSFFFSWVHNLQRCAKKQTIKLEGIFAFLWNIIFILWLMNTIYESQLFVRGCTAFNPWWIFFFFLNYKILVWKFKFTAHPVSPLQRQAF